MPHVHPDTLALRAIGDSDGSSEDATHLHRCEPCQQELAELRDVVARVRDLEQTEQTLPDPPSRLWDRIAEAVAVDTVAGAAPHTAAGAIPPSASVPRRQRSRRLLAAAASVAVLAVGVAGLLLDREGESTLIATAALAPLDDRAAITTAELVVDDGEQMLHLHDDGLPSAEGYHEVWLIDRSVEGMVSLGPVDERGHRVPDGLDLDQYPIVDVSLEPYDGDPTHSGDSILRGELGPTAEPR